MTDELVSWDKITESNEQLAEDDPLKFLTGMASSKDASDLPKKKRGRPRKIPTPTQETVAEIPQIQQINEISRGFIPAQPTAEEMMSNQELVKIIKESESGSGSASGRKKSSLKFSTESAPDISEPETSSEDPDRVTLLKMYKQYFREPLISKHKRKEKTWADSNLNSDIYRELKALENAVSEDDPAAILGQIWVGGMGAVETFGPSLGLETYQLTAVAAATSNDEKFKATMRELLLKYPYLRVMIGLGGYPELKLLITTVTLIKEVDNLNRQKAASMPPTTPGVPEDLRYVYSEI